MGADGDEKQLSGAEKIRRMATTAHGDNAVNNEGASNTKKQKVSERLWLQAWDRIATRPTH